MTSILQGKKMIVDSMRFSMSRPIDKPSSIALMFWGPPGIGKSQMVGQAARELGIGFKPVISHLYTPPDILGYPYLEEAAGHKTMQWAEPGIFPNAGRDGERGLFFLDELPNCVPAMMSAWGIIILERTTHMYKFPPGWAIVCAGNNQTDRAGSSRMLSMLENRLIQVNVKPSLSEFTTYGIETGMHPAILAYLERFPDKLIAFDPKSPERGFPSPRSWDRVNEILQMMQVPYEAIEVTKGEVDVSSNSTIREIYDWIGGAIGGGATIEFMAYLSLWRDMPPLSAILDGSSDITQLADRPDLYAGVVTSVLVWALQQPDQSKVNTAMNVIVRMMESKKSREYPMLMMLKLWQARPHSVLAAPAWKALAGDFMQYTKPSATGAPKVPSLRK